jgi:hypothetical protein
MTTLANQSLQTALQIERAVDSTKTNRRRINRDKISGGGRESLGLGMREPSQQHSNNGPVHSMVSLGVMAVFRLL